MPGSTRSYEMATRLAKRGHDVHIISSKRDSKKFSKNWKTESLLVASLKTIGKSNVFQWIAIYFVILIVV